MATIHKRTETARGCGYRVKGGLYLVTGTSGSPCGKLPAPLTVCPCCGSGVKFSRGFTWISTALFSAITCRREDLQVPEEALCWACPLGSPGLRLGLMWVGEKFYKTAAIFTEEADRLGISKRIARVPHDFDLGRTWIALAHIKAIRNHSGAAYMTPAQLEDNPEFSPGVFRCFRPTAIEYIITGKETEEELDDLEKRGFTLVDVTRDIDKQVKIFD